MGFSYRSLLGYAITTLAKFAIAPAKIHDN
jgi:hypothetical protein